MPKIFKNTKIDIYYSVLFFYLTINKIKSGKKTLFNN